MACLKYVTLGRPVCVNFTAFIVLSVINQSTRVRDNKESADTLIMKTFLSARLTNRILMAN